MVNFRTYTENNKSFIERLVFPRFTAEITFNPNEASDLENIQMIDDCFDYMELASAMREAGDYLIQKKDE